MRLPEGMSGIRFAGTRGCGSHKCSGPDTGSRRKEFCQAKYIYAISFAAIWSNLSLQAETLSFRELIGFRFSSKRVFHSSGNVLKKGVDKDRQRSKL